MQQIPLELRWDHQVNLDSFLTGKNQVLIDYVKQIEQLSDGHFIYIWGESSVGKSHLLQALANRFENHPVIYLGLDDPDISARVLDGLEYFQGVFIDDIQAIEQQSDWEEGLFHLFNRLKDTGQSLIVCSNVPPNEINIALPDLKSRFNSMITFKLAGLSDNDKMVLLQQQASVVGLEVPDEVARFVLNRSSRDLTALLNSFKKLDKASLIEQRKITVPFVKQVLGL